MRHRTRPACRIARGLTILIATVIAAALVRVPATSAQTPPPYEIAETDAARMLLEAGEMWSKIGRSWDPNDPLWYLNGDPARVDPASARQFHEQFQPMMNLFRRAMRDGDIRFAPIDPGAGPQAYGRQVIWLRSLAGAASYDLYYRMHIGDHSQLARDFQSLMKMSYLARADGTPYGSLYSVALISGTMYWLEDAIGYGAIDPAGAKMLRDELGGFIEHDLMGYGAAIRDERERAIDWLREMNADDETRDRILDIYGQGLIHGHNPEGAANLASLSANEMTVAIEMYDAAYQRFESILSIDDFSLAKTMADQLNADINNGIYGPLAQINEGLFSARIIDSLSITLDNLDRVLTKLDTVVTHPDGANALLNAAHKYKAAFGILRRLPADVRIALGVEVTRVHDWTMTEEDEAVQRQQMAQRDPHDRERIAAALDAAAEVFDLLSEASEIAHCQFVDDVTLQRSPPLSRPWSLIYLAPLFDAMRARLDHLLTADPGAPQEDDEVRDEHRAATHESARILLAMIDHAAGEGTLDACLFGLEAAKFLDEAFEPESAARIDLGGDERIGPILDRFKEHDPFGFRGFLSAEVDRLRRWRDELRDGSGSILESAQRRPDSLRGFSTIVGDAEAARMKEEASRLDRERLRLYLGAVADDLYSRPTRLLAAKSHEEIDTIEAELLEFLASDPPAELSTWHEVYMRHYLRAARESIESRAVWARLRGAMAPAAPAAAEVTGR